MEWKRSESVVPSNPFRLREGDPVVEFCRDGTVVRVPESIAGRYHVTGLLGAGGMGAILVAHDKTLGGRPVLIKMALIRDYAANFMGTKQVEPSIYQTTEDRFRSLEREFETLRKLHEKLDDRIPVVCNFVRDYSALMDGPHEARPGEPPWYWHEFADPEVGELLTQEPYLVLRYIDGLNLVDRKPKDVYGDQPDEFVRAVLRLGRELSSLLAEFHGREFTGSDDGETRESWYHVYQDLKPENVVWTERGDFFLIDFGGVATVRITAEGTHRFDGLPVGTEAYQAPETRPESDPNEIRPMALVSEMSDIYSLGATLFAVWTGARPPRDQLHEAVLRQRGLSDPLFKPLFDVMATCVIADPADRRAAVLALSPPELHLAGSIPAVALRQHFVKLQGDF
jgi:serine/threonine protein kinase